jgi:hypothetical protein
VKVVSASCAAVTAKVVPAGLHHAVDFRSARSSAAALLS